MIEVTYSTKIDMLRAGKQIVKYNSNCSVPPSEELNSHPSHLIMRILMQPHQWTANGTFGPVSKWVFFFFLQESVNAAVHSSACGPTAQYMGHHWDVGKA